MMFLIQPAIGKPPAQVEVPPTGDLRPGIENPEFALLLGQVEGDVPVPESPPPLVPPPPPVMPTGSEEAILDEPNARGIQPDFFPPQDATEATETQDLADENEIGTEGTEMPEDESEHRTAESLGADLWGLLPFMPMVGLPVAPPLASAQSEPIPSGIEGVAPVRSTIADIPADVESVPATAPSAPVHTSEALPSHAAFVEQPTDDGIPVHPMVKNRESADSLVDRMVKAEAGIETVFASNDDSVDPLTPTHPSIRSATASAFRAGMPAAIDLPAAPVHETPGTVAVTGDHLLSSNKAPAIGTREALDLLNPVAIEVRQRTGPVDRSRPEAMPAQGSKTTTEPVPGVPSSIANAPSIETAHLSPVPKPIPPAQLPTEAVGTPRVDATLADSAQAPSSFRTAPAPVQNPDGMDLPTVADRAESATPSNGADLSDGGSEAERSDAENHTNSVKPTSPSPTAHSSPPTASVNRAGDPRATQPEIEPRAIGHRIAERIEEMFASRRSGTVTIQLDPKDLGSITLTVRSFGNRVDAEIGATHEGVRAALAENRQQLSQSIESRGLSLGQLSLSDHRDFSQGTPWNHSDAREDLQRYANVRLADDPRPARSDATPWPIANDQSVDYRI